MNIHIRIKIGIRYADDSTHEKGAEFTLSHLLIMLVKNQFIQYRELNCYTFCDI